MRQGVFETPLALPKCIWCGVPNPSGLLLCKPCESVAKALKIRAGVAIVPVLNVNEEPDD